jgi:hypothetical protein
MIPDQDKEFKSLPPEDWNIRIIEDPDGGCVVEPVMSEHGRKVFEAVAASHGMTDQEFFAYLIRSQLLDLLPSNDR